MPHDIFAKNTYLKIVITNRNYIEIYSMHTLILSPLKWGGGEGEGEGEETVKTFGGIFVGNQRPIAYHNIKVFGDLGFGES